MTTDPILETIAALWTEHDLEAIRAALQHIEVSNERM